MDYKTFLKENALRKQEIIRLRKKKWTWRRIGLVFGITAQRAQAIGKQ